MSTGDCSSDEDLAPDHVPYSERKEWADVIPIEQDDGQNPVVLIAYSEKFKDVYDYFRAILSKQEKSLRALDLTKDALRLNAANYTVWQYRRDIIKALNLDLENELDYSEEVILDNPKNYQVWHHRRVIVEWLSNPDKELRLTEDVLNMDAKNYHAWQHRQWAIKTYSLFDDELTYVDRLISEDVRNNSAWNQRFFVLKHTGFTTDVLQREINYVKMRIHFVKNNESTWNFLRGLLQQGDGTMDQFPEVVDFCEELYTAGVRSPHLIAFLIDLYEEKCIRGNTDEDNVEELSKKVFDYCKMMATDVDKIREKYWEYVAGNFKIQMDRRTANNKKSPVVDSENEPFVV
ncbi:protein farnesyltransferase/geranylgeranyltransferase type-1 subunit alpha [Bradysia coprophila]|uniref:protein farnesyltransferase/geranylgeranyltransferase type-1 subunit alpha n=1 Tax=Bradysia coprophila TaxID=38358 RepID=UPI00187DC0D7|nr:protein farnesyltransferase/geranylgeranyltransferase type-1 subunit alpha [Bradysia coprophila]XP_037025205.1 protein farnesyltransferase/geranylgeranyltransferase type-1 subunit alpha [Bradysia coprophila]